MGTTNAKSVFNGTLGFGLIDFSIKTYSAARSEGTGFNQVHQHANGDVTKINEQKFCSGCNSVVAHADLKKGYEVSKGSFVVIEENELKALAPAKSEAIKITSFVPTPDVDPVFFDKSYFLVAEDKGDNPKKYELLFQIMKDTNKAGMAKFTMRGKEHNAIVRVYGKGLMMHTIFTSEEVRELMEFNATREVKVNEQEVALGRMLLDQMTQEFDRTAVVSEYDTKVQALIESKTAVGTSTNGAAPTVPVVPKDDSALMAALSASLFAMKSKKIAA
jgi:DNA end-binding protein Ku